jgi:hypothetical protein
VSTLLLFKDNALDAKKLRKVNMIENLILLDQNAGFEKIMPVRTTVL